MYFPWPKWITEMPEGMEKRRAENLFFFRLWSVYASREGNFTHLAQELGVNYHALKSQATDRKVCGATDTTLEAVEAVLGPEFLPPRRVPYQHLPQRPLPYRREKLYAR